MKSIWKLSCFLFVIVAVIVSADEETKEQPDQKSDETDSPQDIIRKFKEQIGELRKDQFERIKVIASLQLDTDRKTYVEYLFQTGVKNFKELQKAVDNASYTSDMPLPEDKNLTGAIAVIYENTLFLSEIAARIFKVVREVMKEHPEFFDTLKWAIQFCQKSESLIDDSDKHILDIASKELNVLAPDSSYQNPFDGWQEKVFDEQPKYQYKDFKAENQRKDEL